MIIKILAGVYGHNENGRVRPVRAGDPPIDVADAIGARLVHAGVAAEIVPEIPDGATLVNALDEELADDIETANFPDYGSDMTRDELEAIGVEVGLDPDELKKAKNKAAVIAMLDEARAEFDEEGDAPDLDPAAAIQ